MLVRNHRSGRLGLAALVLVACLAAPAVRAADVTVFAAASLKTALDNIAAAWKAESGKEATISYAASSALAKQIDEGAPADVFISADVQWMDYLAERGLVQDETVVELLGNRLVLIAPAGSAASLGLTEGSDLVAALGDGYLAVGQVDSVPAGKYAREALTSLGVFDQLSDRLAQAENVRAALALVATGEAPLGIVYQTDATAEKRVRIVASFPADSHSPIIYPAAVRADATSADAGAFLGFLRSAIAAGLFRAEGFTVLAPGD